MVSVRSRWGHQDGMLARFGKAVPLRYRRGRIIYAQDDPADAMFFIRSGRVKVTVRSRDGRQVALAILGRGEFLGEGCLHGRAGHLHDLRDLRGHRHLRHLSSAVAMTDCSVIRIGRSMLWRLLRSDPEFAVELTGSLANRGQRIEQSLANRMLMSSEQRLATVLLVLADLDRTSPDATSVAKISQATLAELVGTTRSRVSQFMNKFRRLGLISYNGGLHLNRSLAERFQTD